MKRIISVYIHLFIPKGKQRDIYAILLPLFIFFNLHFSLSQDWIRSRAPFLEQRSLPLFAGVDSSRLEFFPLKIGNLWQWRDLGGGTPKRIHEWSIVSDTLLGNGEKYYKCQGGVTESISSGYVRIDKDFYVQCYISTPCGTSQDEFNIYRLTNGIGTTWIICQDIAGLLYDGERLVKLNDIFEAKIFGENRFVMELAVGGVDHGDTLFPYRYYLVKGIGIFFEQYEISNYQCTGAIINGKVYGTIVKIERDNPIPMDINLYCNFPNPFKQTTQINYQLPERYIYDLKILNILGKEIYAIVKEEREAGNYSVIFNRKHLPAGIYFCRLSATNSRTKRTAIKTIKMIIVD